LVARPQNDDLATAQEIERVDDLLSVGNVAATAEPGEPAHEAGFAASHSVWFKWTAPGSGDVRFETSEATFAHSLAIYTGGSIPSLRLVKKHEPFASSKWSREVEFRAEEDTTYLLAFDSASTPSETGNLWLTGEFEESPPNDHFADASPLRVPGTVSGSLRAASAEQSEPPHSGSRARTSIWFTWTAPESGSLELDTSGSEAQVEPALYVGSALPNLTRSGPVTRFPLTFRVEEGERYSLAVDTRDGFPNPGAVRITASLEPDPEPPAEPPAPSPSDPPKVVPKPEIWSAPLRRTRSRSATFRFSGVEGAAFQCRRNGQRRWSRCYSPLRLAGLRRGRHVMRIRQISEGTVSQVVVYPWTVKRR